MSGRTKDVERQPIHALANQERQRSFYSKETIGNIFPSIKVGNMVMADVSTIAAEAGLTRQLTRYYFPDLEALISTVCDDMAEKYRSKLLELVGEQEEGTRSNTFFDFYFDQLHDAPKPRDDQSYDAAFAFAAGSPKIRDALKVQYSLLGHVVSHELQLENPKLGRDGALELSYLFVCLMYGHWKMVASLGLSEDHNQVARQAIDRLIISYLKAPPESARGAPVWTSK